MHPLLLPPAVMIFAIIAMILLHQHIPLMQFWDAPVSWVGVPMIVLGLAIAQWHSRLFKLRKTNINTFKDPDILVTDGLFRISRNPMYLGFLVCLAGVWIVLGSASPLIVLAGFGLLTNHWYIPFEEQAMLRKFGDTYINYKSTVRRWL